MQRQDVSVVSNPRVLAYERLDPRDESLEWLRSCGVDVRFGSAHSNPAFLRYAEDQLIEEAQGCHGLLGSSSGRITRKVIESLPELRFISKLGIGVDTIDVEAATANGVLVSNTPDPGAATAVAEHAVAMMLGLAKRLNIWTPAFMREGGWR
jgi:D-3-phosphoglycerate dehydrogenase / 2-oxoglutarate reductase